MYAPLCTQHSVGERKDRLDVHVFLSENRNTVVLFYGQSYTLVRSHVCDIRAPNSATVLPYSSLYRTTTPIASMTTNNIYSYTWCVRWLL